MPHAIFAYCPMCATPLIEKNVSGMPRAVCPACSFIHFQQPKLVAVVVVQYQDTLLLGKRNIEPGKGLWNFCGGYVELGETVEAAAIREVKEESNLDVQLGRLIGVYSAGNGSHIIIAYQASMLDHQVSSLAAQPEEVSELAFFRWENLPTLAFPVHQDILRDWRQLLN